MESKALAGMNYSETLEDQNAKLKLRYEQVCKYLNVSADIAEDARRREWAISGTVKLDDYESHMLPFRSKLKQMIAYPPPGTPVEAKPCIREIGRDEDGTIFRVTMQLLEEGLDSYGLLIIPHEQSKELAVAIHGGGGTPEIAASLHGSNNYHDMGRRLARRGHPVWMPACYERLSMNTDLNQLNIHEILDLKARMVGSTLSAIDLYSIIHSTKAILNTDFAPSDRAVAVGLSYGGFRALAVTALSDIFCACVSSCYFNDRRRILEQNLETTNFRDWYFGDVLGMVTDIELCRLICPRPLYIEVAVNDEIFPVDGAFTASEDVIKLYDGLGIGERFGFDAFEGVHEFSGNWAFAFLTKIGL